jgi:hypothetical protein
MNPASNSRCTLAFAAYSFSFNISRSFCFLGFTCELTCSLCSITSLLTPIRSDVDQAKASLFLLRNCRSSACSCGLISVLTLMVLSGTLGSSATLFKSSLASIAFLNSAWTEIVLAHAALCLPLGNAHFCGTG